jgi:hypothetical protein
MEVLKNVLIKEVDGGKNGDKVVFVDNLPKSFLYRKAIKLMVDYTNPQQNLVPEFELDERGRKIPTGATVDELLPGIELSQTGDEAFVFFVNMNESRMRLADIDRYIQGNMPVTERIQPRVWYSSQPGVMTAYPRPLNQIPRVVLPEPVSPPVKTVQVAASSPVIQSVDTTPKAKKVRKPMTEEQKAAARQRMAVARATKASKAK